MDLRFRHETLELGFRDPFRIARAMDEGERAVTVILELWDAAEGPGGVVGLGEGFPDAYYGETPATIAAVLPILVAAVEAVVAESGDEREPGWVRETLGRAGAAMDDALGNNGAAKCAVDIALHDLAARRLGVAVVDLLGLPHAIPPTDFTIGIDAPSVVAERAARARRFPALKIKVGGPADIDTLEAVRAVYDGPIRVDANTAWRSEQGARLVPELIRLGVELIEQPFPAHRLDQLAWLQERSALPIVADESAVSILDLDGLRGVVAGVNVKLAKCGGIGPGLRMIRRARELGMKVMLGCMFESSLGTAAGAMVASEVDWLDLDGNLMMVHDPFEGIELGDDCRWQLTSKPGLGIGRRASA
ncbi:MAG: dipeptide epimerase [Candidatus Limnocylindrales bacterium]